MSAQPGTGAKQPVIQKLHATAQTNVKLKLNRRAAKLLLRNDSAFMLALRQRLTRKVFQ